MTAMVTAVIEWDKLLEVVWVSILAGIGATSLFAVVIYGSSRAAEARRTASGSGGLYGALAFTALTAFVAIVVVALLVMFQKD